MQYGVKIFVMTSFKDTCYIEIQPKVVKSNKGILIFFVSTSKCVVVLVMLQLTLNFRIFLECKPE